MAFGSGVIRSGARGSAVREIQQFLADAGFDPGPIDGIYGSRTTAAVRQWQSSVGLTADGLFGPASRAAAEGGEGAGGEGGTRALPQNSRIVKVGNEYRLVWQLGEGLGWAWYEGSPQQFSNLYGADWRDEVSNTYLNAASFTAQYGNNFWGNVAEISLTADDPWTDMRDRIFQSFGVIPGFETPEIRRLILQGYFEGWSQTEFLAHYNQSEYYNSQSDIRREWAGLSETERQLRVDSKTAQLADLWRRFYGEDPAGGLNNPDLIRAATSIVSGEEGQDVWEYNTRVAAAQIEGTPAYQDAISQEQSEGAMDVNIHNLRGRVEDMWREWMGPLDMPSVNWSMDKARLLFMNDLSQQELEDSLRSQSQSAWQFKPPDLTWREWSTGARAVIRNQLELSEVGDSDALLGSILTQGLTGQDVVSAVRQDPRYRSTQNFYHQLSNAANDLGRQFGFVPGR